MGLISILSLYCATCSLGSVVSSYSFILGVWNHFRISASHISGANLEILGLAKDISGIGWTTPSTLEIISLNLFNSLAMDGVIPVSRTSSLVFENWLKVLPLSGFRSDSPEVTPRS
ncbi:hypothetical protein L1987_06427 [Smallanthus sonchifolius]|uniref:Uncharacterized protein n=1 Tax=Smallanthus sonchifolius TaxID=185202 RepID=A0ACB9JY34_9ASTR|nr:hypothetical protein L1987_06427 [Smallanthus sonchifolius]